MILYLDTSVLVSALTNEPETPRIQDWLGSQTGELAISEWISTELSSALSIKLRTGQLDAAGRAGALAMFAGWRADVFILVPISDLHVRAAARFADQHELGVRAGDALHLAISADAGAILCTRDRRLQEAGLALGVATILV